jgi:hypothetical protein
MASVRALRERLGDESMSGLQTLLDDAGRQWKDNVLSISGERFDRRLAQEIGHLRVDMAKEFAAVRCEMAREFAAVRTEMAKGFADVRTDVVKWAFLFWIGQFAATSGMMIFLFRTFRP